MGTDVASGFCLFACLVLFLQLTPHLGGWGGEGQSLIKELVYEVGPCFASSTGDTCPVQSLIEVVDVHGSGCLGAHFRS